MLFLGTEKYPAEDAYSQFLTANGGVRNAYTASENTNYYFTVNSDKLEEALDRFAQFFIGPLFNEDAVKREINAVNSEYEKNKGIPVWYIKELMKEVADPDSSFSKYVHLSCSTVLCANVCIVTFVQSVCQSLAVVFTFNVYVCLCVCMCTRVCVRLCMCMFVCACVRFGQSVDQALAV